MWRARTPRSRAASGRARSTPGSSWTARRSASSASAGSPSFDLGAVVAPRPRGAATEEAQEKPGVAVAGPVRQALAGELVPDAVNVQGGTIAEDVRPGLPLAENLGRLFTGLAGGGA